MGAGQIGGIATLVDIDFRNAAGFLGEPAKSIEGQHIVHYLSHAMIFCVGALLEAHVVLTPAICVYGERYKFHVFAGTHKFIDGPGISRQVNHLCVHRGYNHSMRWNECSPDNLALLVLGQQFSFNSRESGSDFLPNRVRYGTTAELKKHIGDTTCHYFGWGSRRNGYLVPLLINLLRVDATILPDENCLEIWNNQEKFLCLQQPRCRSENHGALCPDDLGTVLVCSGYVVGIMTSRLIDRPCGVGFLDLSLYNKFLTCSIDDSRDVIDIDEEFMSFDYKGISQTPATRPMVTVNINETTDETP
ncbi:uncharacterized protein LOC126977511 [Leptidea sinapis]|uniref:uncharacterized protein LOC126977511 n=1 Tax=Leptidea sinapis TaxID=189913 RepID=UPI00213007BD|nr:uncharacterized protein LOC126977511 [Leptidea sinapis]